jgi:hypothetical protein
MNIINLLLYSFLVGIFWTWTYYYIRRIPNPNLKLLHREKILKLKNDKNTQIKLEEYWYDAVYGGIATGLSYFIVRSIRELGGIHF